MKFLSCGLALILLVSGCSVAQTHQATREEIQDRIEVLVEVENRANALVKQGSTPSYAYQDGALVVRRFTQTQIQQLKQHYDLYYVFHKAAAVHLVEGETAKYERNILDASTELDAIENILNGPGI